MCVEKLINGIVIQCCPDKTCLGEVCIQAVIAACKNFKEGTEDEVKDLSWIMLCVPLLFALLFWLMKKLR